MNPETQQGNGSRPVYRIDTQLHDALIQKKEREQAAIPVGAEELKLPEPVFPQRTKGIGDQSKAAYDYFNAVRGLRGWAVPYFKSRFKQGVRPIIPYLFTEYKCNVDCQERC